jgi:hypothetical protein
MKLPFDTVAGTILCGLLLTLILYLLVRHIVMGG